MSRRLATGTRSARPCKSRPINWKAANHLAGWFPTRSGICPGSLGCATFAGHLFAGSQCRRALYVLFVSLASVNSSGRPGLPPETIANRWLARDPPPATPTARPGSISCLLLAATCEPEDFGRAAAAASKSICSLASEQPTTRQRSRSLRWPATGCCGPVVPAELCRYCWCNNSNRWADAHFIHCCATNVSSLK